MDCDSVVCISKAKDVINDSEKLKDVFHSSKLDKIFYHFSIVKSEFFGNFILKTKKMFGLVNYMHSDQKREHNDYKYNSFKLEMKRRKSI